MKLLFIFVYIMCSFNAHAEQFKKLPIESIVESQLEIKEINEETLKAELILTIKPGWSIYSIDDRENSPPIKITPAGQEKILPINWPESKNINKAGYHLSIYEGLIKIPIELKKPSANIIAFNLEYIACNKVCIPAKQLVKASLTGQSIYKSLTYILFAFLGGILLNIMPCVLPILSIKLYTLFNQDLLCKKHKLFYSIAGIISAFVIISIFALILRSSGNFFGWGMHFQNPYFIIAVSIVMLFTALSLLDKINLNLPSSLSTLLASNPSYFFSGIFSTFIAVPCVAPMVAAAISFALSQNSFVLISIFISMSLGFSLPYIIFAFMPSAVSILPKPGIWMIKVKYMMAIASLVVCAWLLYIINNQLSQKAAIILFMLFILIKFFLEQALNTLLKCIIIIALVIGCFTLPEQTFLNQAQAQQEINSVWQPFSIKALNQAIKDKRLVIVDVSADWCITCKINKLTTLNNQSILNYIKENQIIALKADITNSNKEAQKYMFSLNRHGIPLTVIYGPNFPKGYILNELLTPGYLTNILNNAN
jgi:suppressor for copper-sensitivity B